MVSSFSSCCFLYSAISSFSTVLQSSRKSARVYRTESYKMIKMYLKIQDIFTRPNEFLPDMSGSQTEFREDWYSVILGRWADENEMLCVVEPHLRSKTEGKNSPSMNLFQVA